MYEKKYWLYLAVFIPIVIIMVLYLISFPRKPLPEIEKPTLDDIEIKAYEAFMERCKLLISLTTALIGAIGFIFIWEKKGEIKTNNFEKSFMLISAILAGFSIYFGYITYSRIVEFLSNKMFNLSSAYLSSPIAWEFWTFLCSIIFFMVFVFINMFITRKDR